uniref:Uncharacterized protein n=1 Tax=Rhipicephalus zambeziensis TaxID=60191 RepID=A0A224YK04_9ACAR
MLPLLSIFVRRPRPLKVSALNTIINAIEEQEVEGFSLAPARTQYATDDQAIGGFACASQRTTRAYHGIRQLGLHECSALLKHMLVLHISAYRFNSLQLRHLRRLYNAGFHICV